MTTMLAPPMSSEATITRKQADYMAAWRELWLDHVYWTRLTVLGIVHDIPGLEQTEARLLRNVDDMIGLLTPEYGSEALAGFRSLLRDHLLIAAKLVTEAKQGSSNAAQTERDWYVNADDMSKFLSTANPNLPYGALKDMFDRHLAMTKDEAVCRLTGDYDRDIPNYEDIEAEALMMADALAAAVIRQFPDRFE